MNDQNAAIASSIGALGAVQVAPETYALQYGDRWYLAPLADLVEFSEADRQARAFIAATWKPLPTWWTPNQQFAVFEESDYDALAGSLLEPNQRRWKPNVFSNRYDAAIFAAGANFPALPIFTADLETGQEVPA